MQDYLAQSNYGELSLRDFKRYIERDFFEGMIEPSAKDLSSLEIAVRGNKSWDKNQVDPWINSLWKRLYDMDYPNEIQEITPYMESLSLKPGNPYTVYKRLYEYQTKLARSNQTINEFKQPIVNLRYSSDGSKLLVCESNTKKIIIYDVNTMQKIRGITFPPFFAIKMETIQISPNGNYILLEVRPMENEFLLINIDDIKWYSLHAKKKGLGNNYIVCGFHFTQNIVYGIQSGTIYSWNLADVPRGFFRSIFQSLSSSYTKFYGTLVSNVDTLRYSFTDFNGSDYFVGTSYILNLKTSEVTDTSEKLPHIEKFNPKNNLIAFYSRDRIYMKIYSLDQNRQVYYIKSPPQTHIMNFTFNLVSDESIYSTSGYDIPSGIYIYKDGVSTQILTFPEKITYLECNPKGDSLAIGMQDGRVIIHKFVQLVSDKCSNAQCVNTSTLKCLDCNMAFCGHACHKLTID